MGAAFLCLKINELFLILVLTHHNQNDNISNMKSREDDLNQRPLGQKEENMNNQNEMTKDGISTEKGAE